MKPHVFGPNICLCVRPPVQDGALQDDRKSEIQ